MASPASVLESDRFPDVRDGWEPPSAPLRMEVQDLSRVPDRHASPPPAPSAAVAARSAAIVFATLAALAAGAAFADSAFVLGIGAMDVMRVLLIAASTWWLAFGAAQALTGVLAGRARPRAAAPHDADLGATVILMPVCGEEPAETWSRIAAMEASLSRDPQGARFDIAVLSDTRDEGVAAAERHWHARLISERAGTAGLYYRRRDDRTGRKAGNIADFIRSSGGRYEFAVVLDSDSLMEATTIVEMVRRMTAEPRLGLIQTNPRVIRGRSRFGRAMQFASALHAPVFARGLDAGQGQAGPFWGHNAVFRVRAFADSCGLPVLSGRAPFGGEVLSHDYAEAALLSRAGWIVRLDPDLDGSYEEGPQTLIDHARRDRRWCQGNLQHARLVKTAGLGAWSRFVFIQGILSYVAPVLWLGFLVAGIVAPLISSDLGCGLVCESGRDQVIWLVAGVVGLLFLPKLLILGRALLSGPMGGFGGRLAATRSALAEMALSTLVAPVLMAWQARSVIEVLAGRDGGWPSRSGSGEAGLAEAWADSDWIVAGGALGLLSAASVTPTLALWLLPVAGPMIMAPVIILWSGRPGDGRLWEIPEETGGHGVVALHAEILRRWQGDAVDDRRDGTWRPAPALV
jgi:membrane glycosyltransferase